MVGLLTRVPLGPFSGRGRSSGSGSVPPGGAAAALDRRTASDAAAASPRVARLGSGVPQLLRGSVEWLRSQGGSCGKLTGDRVSLRPFASGGALLQLGSFQGHFLDFTRIMAKVS